MERSSKKRIARIGHVSSKDQINPMNDVVADIMKKMDASMTDTESFKIFASPSYRKRTDKNNPQMPSTVSTQPNITPRQQKKFLPTKRHPLMEKAQKSKNYIKHNRSIPKPRAHLGGMEDPIQRKMDIDARRSFSSVHSEKKKPSGRSTKSNVANVVFYNTINSDSSSKSRISTDSEPQNFDTDSGSEFESFKQGQKSDTDSGSEFESFKQGQKSDTDSEYDFESFIQAQKLDRKCDEQTTTKSKKKSKLKNEGRKRRKLTKEKCIKSNKRKPIEQESEEESVSSSNISSKITTTNRLKLPETSESSLSSADESQSTNVLFEIEHTTSKPSFEKENRIDSIEQIATDSSMCTVRIERNLLLDEVLASNSPLKDIKNYEFSSQLDGNKKIDLTDCEDKTIVDSDDDCLIVCELPNSSNQFDDSATKKIDAISDIQIVNVVSIGENEAINRNDENAVSVSPMSSFDENSDRTIEQRSNLSTLDKTFITESNHTNSNFSTNITEGRLLAATECNLNDDVCLPIASSVMDIVNKIDLKQVLSLTSNAGNRSSPDMKHLDSLTSSSPCTVLPQKNPEIITEDHWLNLKKAVTLNNCSTNEQDYNISASSLREIISAAEQLARASGENILPDRNIQEFQLREDSYENPSDELDDYVTASIREHWPNESPQNVSKLRSIYGQVLQEYNKIKMSERSISYSLKILQESADAKKKHLETVVKRLMEHDPCFYTTAKNCQDTVHNNGASSSTSTENGDLSSYQVKSCINCGSKATILCNTCQKVYFCSRECGVFYWENGHYRTCEGLKR